MLADIHTNTDQVMIMKRCWNHVDFAFWGLDMSPSEKEITLKAHIKETEAKKKDVKVELDWTLR